MRPPSPLRSTTAALVTALSLLALAGCAKDDPAPAVPSTPLSGPFDVTSRFQVPATVAAPGPLGDALRLLHTMSTEPGAAILDLAELAGVPAVAELRLVLPSALEAELAGWMTDYLMTAAPGAAVPLDELARIDALVRSVLLDFQLRSTLTPEVGSGGRHAPVALLFGPAGAPVVVPLDPTAPVTAGVAVTAALTWPDGLAAPPVAVIGDHFMGIPFGRYALLGLDALAVSELGAADLGAFLTGTVDCAGMAASVAGRCVGPVCVGNEARVLSICQGGVAALASTLEARIQALDFKALHLRRGRAVPLGELTADAVVVTRLEGGVWDASIDLGNGAEAATATFTAVR